MELDQLTEVKPNVDTVPKYVLSTYMEEIECSDGKIRAVGQTVWRVTFVNKRLEFKYDEICDQERLIEAHKRGIPKSVTNYVRNLLVPENDREADLFRKLNTIDSK